MVPIPGAARRCANYPCPRTTRVLALAGVLSLLLAGLAASPSLARPRRARPRCRDAHSRVRQASRRQLQAAVVCLINLQRGHRGLPKLRVSQLLNRSAQGWTNYMATHRVLAHGANFSARISAVGFRWSQAGENIAAGYGTPASVVRAWMASPGHCRNILTPTFTEVGTGVGFGRTGPMRSGTWTQDFALPLLANARSDNWGPADSCPHG